MKMNKLHLISNVKVNQARIENGEYKTVGLNKIICKEMRILCQKKMRLLSI